MKTPAFAFLVLVFSQVCGQNLINQPFGLTEGCISSPIFVDIDGDGDLDVFGAGVFGKASQFFFQENVGTKTSPVYSEPQYRPFGLTAGSLSSPIFVDIDGDGDLDVFGAGVFGKAGQIFFQENVGTKISPVYSEPQYKPFGLTTGSLSSPTFYDIDGDGDLDVFAVGTYGKAGQIFFQENTGTNVSPIYSEPQYKPFGLTSGCLKSPIFVDIDGNGVVDVFGTGTYGKASSIFVFLDVK